MNRLTSIILTASVVVLALAAVFGIMGLEQLQRSNDRVSDQLNDVASVLKQEAPKELQDKIKEGGYQAVFLDGGQVYFGKLTETSGGYFSLTDVFYLKGADSPNGTFTEGDVSLIKLGNELHGPEDFMYIPKSKVLFVENLKDDGQVAKSIQTFKQSQ